MNHDGVVRAAHDVFGGSVGEYICVDISEHMMDCARQLLKGGEVFDL